MGTTEEQKKAIEYTTTDIWAVRRRLQKTFPSSRELSLTLTKLDEAVMWAKQIPVEQLNVAANETVPNE